MNRIDDLQELNLPGFPGENGCHHPLPMPAPVGVQAAEVFGASRRRQGPHKVARNGSAPTDTGLPCLGLCGFARQWWTDRVAFPKHVWRRRLSKRPGPSHFPALYSKHTEHGMHEVEATWVLTLAYLSRSDIMGALQDFPSPLLPSSFSPNFCQKVQSLNFRVSPKPRTFHPNWQSRCPPGQSKTSGTRWTMVNTVHVHTNQCQN